MCLRANFEYFWKTPIFVAKMSILNPIAGTVPYGISDATFAHGGKISHLNEFLFEYYNTS